MNSSMVTDKVTLKWLAAMDDARRDCFVSVSHPHIEKKSLLNHSVKYVVRFACFGKEYQVERSYKDCVALSKLIDERFDQDIYLPPVPPKSFLFDNKSEEFVKERQAWIQHLLMSCLDQPFVRNDQILMTFLASDRPFVRDMAGYAKSIDDSAGVSNFHSFVDFITSHLKLSDQFEEPRSKLAFLNTVSKDIKAMENSIHELSHHKKAEKKLHEEMVKSKRKELEYLEETINKQKELLANLHNPLSSPKGYNSKSLNTLKTEVEHHYKAMDFVLNEPKYCNTVSFLRFEKHYLLSIQSKINHITELVHKEVKSQTELSSKQKHVRDIDITTKETTRLKKQLAVAQEEHAALQQQVKGKFFALYALLTYRFVVEQEMRFQRGEALQSVMSSQMFGFLQQVYSKHDHLDYAAMEEARGKMGLMPSRRQSLAEVAAVPIQDFTPGQDASTTVSAATSLRSVAAGSQTEPLPDHDAASVTSGSSADAPSQSQVPCRRTSF